MAHSPNGVYLSTSQTPRLRELCGRGERLKKLEVVGGMTPRNSTFQTQQNQHTYELPDVTVSIGIHTGPNQTNIPAVRGQVDTKSHP